MARFLCATLLLFSLTGLAAAPTGQYALEADVVVDQLTGLAWQRAPGAKPLTWDEAKRTCEGLRLGGRTGWRLPSKKELATLLEPRATTAATTIDERAFPQTPPASFWTSTRDVQDLEAAWSISFRRGFSIESYPLTERFLVRCVR